MILVYLHKILVNISNFICYQIMKIHHDTNLSILHHYISTIHDAFNTFRQEKYRKKSKEIIMARKIILTYIYNIIT